MMRLVMSLVLHDRVRRVVLLGKEGLDEKLLDGILHLDWSGMELLLWLFV